MMRTLSVWHDKYEEQSNTIIVEYSFECDWPKTVGAVCVMELINHRYTYRADKYMGKQLKRMENAEKRIYLQLNFQCIRHPISAVSGKCVYVLECHCCVRAARKITTLRRTLILL